MQDRYRFRFWNKKTNKWFYFGFETFPTYEKEIWEALTNGEKIYQSSGLKDKYGKLIYEGDVVKTTLANNSEIIFLVVWNNEKATFDGKIIKKEMTYGSEFMIKQDYLYYLLGNGKDEKTEVIGNKFQNPELLSEVG